MTDNAELIARLEKLADDSLRYGWDADARDWREAAAALRTADERIAEQAREIERLKAALRQERRDARDREEGAATEAHGVSAKERTDGAAGSDAASIIKRAVDRFLAWRLPNGFAPDCGVSFGGRGKDASGYDKQWPVGTNLFDAEQARMMLAECVGPEIARLTAERDEARATAEAMRKDAALYWHRWCDAAIDAARAAEGKA